MPLRSGKIERESARRIFEQTRRGEQTPQRAPHHGPPAHGVPFQFRRFTCKDALTPAEGNPGTTATAYLVLWNDTSEEYEVKTDVEFEVRDPSGTRYAAAYDEDNWHRFIGWAVKAFDLPEWEIFYLPQYVMCKGLTKGAVDPGDGTYTVDNVTVKYGANPVTAASDELTVSNIFGDDIDDNATVTFAWRAGVWETEDITCPA